MAPHTTLDALWSLCLLVKQPVPDGRQLHEPLAETRPVSCVNVCGPGEWKWTRFFGGEELRSPDSN